MDEAPLLSRRLDYLHDCIAKLTAAMTALIATYVSGFWLTHWSWPTFLIGAAGYFAIHVYAVRYWRRMGGEDW